MFLPLHLLSSDNTGAINIARGPMKHELTNHIGVDASFVHSGVQDQIIVFQYVPSELQLLDFFMKTHTRLFGWHLKATLPILH